MTIWRKGTSWLTGGLLLGMALPAWSAPPPVSQMLSFKPVQKGVVYTTPSPQEEAQCKVELVKLPPKGSGWALYDAKGNLLRKFYDNDANNYPDQWSYYKDGVEVYRELDSNANGKADQYRWLNAGGMKIGIDKNEDGIIDTWFAMSVEELSQEAVKALASKDYQQLELLMATEDDLKALGAPAAEVNRVKKLQELAPGKFKTTCSKLPRLSENTRWLRLETAAPSRLPSDTTGMKQDVLMHYRGTIMCETAGQHDWIQLGEIVLVGEAWKLIDAPLPGGVDTSITMAGAKPESTSDMDGIPQALLDQLAQIDSQPPKNMDVFPNPAVVAYHTQRADVLVQIILKARDKSPWQKQLSDSLSTAAQASPPADKKALDRLTKLSAEVAQQAPGGEVAAYIAFREISADYAVKISNETKPEAILALQKDWLDRLGKFVGTYPKAEDRPDALLQLGMITELQGQAKEADAKKWYEQLVKDHASSPQAVKATGALRRLNLEGKAWEVNAPFVSLSASPFSLDKVKGKVVVVYYWATWCQSSAVDFAKLKQLALDYKSKGLELVCINVDDAQPEAEAFVRKNNPPGYHIYGGGGIESPLATHYGLIIFPNLFLVGSDGKVVSRTVQIANLEEELKKLLK